MRAQGNGTRDNFTRSSGSAALPGGVSSRDQALTYGAGQTVQAEAARRLAAAIKTRDDRPAEVEHLATCIDAQPRPGIVDDRRRPGRVEWRLGDLVERLGLIEVSIHTGFDEGVVAQNRLRQMLWRHRHALVLHHDLCGKFFDAVCAEEEACVPVNVGRCRVPRLACDGIAVEDRPDGPAAVLPVADARERGVDEIVRIVFDGIGIAMAAGLIWLEAAEDVGGELAAGLVVESLTEHVDQNDVLANPPP